MNRGNLRTGIFGGNSNWRGPIWYPLNFLVIEALERYHHFYGDDFKMECPTGSGQMLTLLDISALLRHRLAALFIKDDKGNRPCYGGDARFSDAPDWRDLVQFFEYFHGDTGKGLAPAIKPAGPRWWPNAWKTPAAIPPPSTISPPLPRPPNPKQRPPARKSKREIPGHKHEAAKPRRTTKIEPRRHDGTT